MAKYKATVTLNNGEVKTKIIYATCCDAAAAEAECYFTDIKTVDVIRIW